MKNLLIVLAVLVFNIHFLQAQVGIGTTTPNASAALEINSTSQGILIPKMTETERDAITSPATGLMIYQIDNTPGFYYWDGTDWLTSKAKVLDDLGDGRTVGTSILLGFNAGPSSTGAGNISLGVSSLSDLTSGTQNIALGSTSGTGTTTGNNNILLGKQTETTSATANNELNIGNTIYATGLYGSGKVGVGNGNKAPNSTLDIDGSVAMSHVSGSSVTLDASHYTYNIKTGIGTTITLPTAIGIEGRIYIIKLSIPGSATINTTSSQTIDGVTSYNLSQYQYVQIQSDGANWIIIGQN